MKKHVIGIIAALLMLFASVTYAEEGFMINARNIPEALEVIPQEYRQSTDQEGTLIRLEYETWESFSYAEHSQRLTKAAWVYLPYGYDEKQP